MKKIVFLVLIISCNRDERRLDNAHHRVDSLLAHSQRINDSSIHLIQLADSTTSVLVDNAIIKVNQLEQTKNTLKKQLKSTIKTIRIKDTIYITEKKNFWGRKKITKDSSSSQSEDTTNDY